MPKSRLRRRSAYTPPTASETPKKKYSPPWLAPLMLVFFALGIVWLVIYYLGSGEAPVQSALENWQNLGIGFGLIMVGFGLATQWR